MPLTKLLDYERWVITNYVKLEEILIWCMIRLNLIVLRIILISRELTSVRLASVLVLGFSCLNILHNVFLLHIVSTFCYASLQNRRLCIALYQLPLTLFKNIRDIETNQSVISVSS